ncbi:FAD-dependent monooxygenase [Streptomyces sp. NPDC050095]|uniref:FAD-dependent monooxygenase n=1 Tax=unclassified Streptomyces TaxID=2593676 RepID=UPI0034480685
MRQTPVLVVGGSLTGLSAALFLGVHGVPALVVERRPDVLAHPRLRGLLPRAMELYRQAGIEAAITAVCPPAEETGRLVSVHAATLDAEHEILGEGPADHVEDPDAQPLTPCRFVPIAQDDLERILVERARKLGADIRFGTELLSLDDDADGVTARLRGPDGAQETVRAHYAVAADGAGSPLRRARGVDWTGPGTLFRMATMFVRADLSAALRGRAVGMAYLDTPATGTTLGPLDASGRHWFFATAMTPGTERAAPADWVRAATGLPDLDVEILEQAPGSGQVLTFPIGARVARQFVRGRVFLAGDAAHLMPPTGGLGGLTAIEDAHNLAWKLARVLRGDAGPALLATYETERRPVAERAVRQSYARGRTRWRFTDQGGEEPLLDLDTLMFATRYGSAGEPAPDPRELRGMPGTRAPHVPVSQDGDEPMSTLDLYGTELVLHVGPEGDAWAAAAARAAQDLGVNVDTYHLDADLAEPHGIGTHGALLVRPDGHVAWRAEGEQEGSEGHFAQVLRGVLHR